MDGGDCVMVPVALKDDLVNATGVTFYKKGPINTVVQQETEPVETIDPVDPVDPVDPPAV